MKDKTIECFAQQTRFDPAADGATQKREVELKDVTITLRESGRDILAHATIKLNAGTRVLLHGQNGTGKSTILRALGKRLIPGIADELRMSYLGQRDGDEQDASSRSTSALEHVIASDNVRSETLDRRASKNRRLSLSEAITDCLPTIVVQAALDSKDAEAPAEVLRKVKHEDHLKKLKIAQREYELRSGARGNRARTTMKQQEKVVEESLAS